jgi:hypothetical protein
VPDRVETFGAAAVVDAEPALAVVLSGERFDGALAAIANFIDLSRRTSPGMLVMARQSPADADALQAGCNAAGGCRD